MQTAHKKWVDSCLSNGENSRNGKWTESIAVGNKPFINNVKALMSGMALGRKVIESGESFQLKEAQYPYNAHLGAKKSDMDAKNAYLWG
jgi:putative transposase